LFIWDHICALKNIKIKILGTIDCENNTDTFRKKVSMRSKSSIEHIGHIKLGAYPAGVIKQYEDWRL